MDEFDFGDEPIIEELGEPTEEDLEYMDSIDLHPKPVNETEFMNNMCEVYRHICIVCGEDHGREIKQNICKNCLTKNTLEKEKTFIFIKDLEEGEEVIHDEQED